MDIPSVVPYVLANRQRLASLRVVGTTCPDHLALSGPACTGSVVHIQHTNDGNGDDIDVDEQAIQAITMMMMVMMNMAMMMMLIIIGHPYLS